MALIGYAEMGQAGDAPVSKMGALPESVAAAQAAERAADAGQLMHWRGTDGKMHQGYLKNDGHLYEASGQRIADNTLTPASQQGLLQYGYNPSGGDAGGAGSRVVLQDQYGQPLGETEENRTNRLRGEYVGAGKELVNLLEQQRGQIAGEESKALMRERQAQGAAENSVRQQAARALASSLAQGGVTSGGGAAAASRQTALEVGGEAGKIRAEAVRRMSEIEQGYGASKRTTAERAAAAKLEQIVAQQEAGSKELSEKETLSSVESEIQAIIARNKGTINDDEDQMYEDMKRLAQRQTNKEVKQQIMARAERIRSGAEDV